MIKHIKLTSNIVVVLFISLLLLVSTVDAAPVQWRLEDGGNGHWYDVITYSSTWEEANLDAQQKVWNGLSGHLATITSQEEQDFLWSNFSYYKYWLGGYQFDKSSEPDGHWAWVTGEPWAYTNWAAGEPNDNLGNEQFIVLKNNCNGQWNDNTGSWLGYIIEYEGTFEPVTVKLTIESYSPATFPTKNKIITIPDIDDQLEISRQAALFALSSDGWNLENLGLGGELFHLPTPTWSAELYFARISVPMVTPPDLIELFGYDLTEKGGINGPHYSLWFHTDLWVQRLAHNIGESPNNYGTIGGGMEGDAWHQTPVLNWGRFYIENIEDEACTTVPLWADGGKYSETGEQIGIVTVDRNGEYLDITYEVDQGWCFSELHLAVELSPEDIPQNKNNSPKVGKFEYFWPGKGEGPLCYDSYKFTVPYPVGYECGDILSIAAHAKVQTVVEGVDRTACEAEDNIWVSDDPYENPDTEGTCTRYESAWAEGTDFGSRNWSTYFATDACAECD